MTIDLNLLTALEALLEEGSVGGAAKRLHVTQPAMSRTLARIREATGDAILIRAGRGMAPTPRALALKTEVASLLRGARGVLAPQRALDLATLERTFTVRCHDALAPALSSALVKRAEHAAPHVTFRFLGENPIDADDLRQGRVDLEIGSSAAAGVRSERIGEAPLAVALRKDSALARGSFTPRRYAAARHVTVSRRGRVRDPIDDALLTLGLERRVVASAPTVQVALQLVRDCDVLATVVRGPLLPEAFGLTMRALPLALPPVPVVQAWAEHLDADLAHRWLREQTRSILDSLTNPKRGR